MLLHYSKRTFAYVYNTLSHLSPSNWLNASCHIYSHRYRNLIKKYTFLPDLHHPSTFNPRFPPPFTLPSPRPHPNLAIPQSKKENNEDITQPSATHLLCPLLHHWNIIIFLSLSFFPTLHLVFRSPVLIAPSLANRKTKLPSHGRPS